MRLLSAHLADVRQAMRLLGLAVVERTLPEITLGKANAYYPGAHRITLRSMCERSLWHELCHSQQPARDAGPAYYRADGSADESAWLAEPREIEAMAVEAMVPLLTDPDLEWAMSVIPAVESPKLRLSWIKWALQADLQAQKPSRLGRRERLRINAAVRNRNERNRR
jgi:hypothetical protein